ncbi:MAG TPA: carboxypeptidase regulatory-like domain-containing protein [Acidobacteriaceae bacterium]|nr:carboxypeptidase regulatory-like domain-containing protein [Acidobacteriaceae bacterium]
MKFKMQSIVNCRVFMYFLLLFLSAGGMAAFGQAGRGAISGTVTDQTGAIIPGAKVTLLNTSTGVATHTTSNASGNYAFISLNPGAYRITASQKGFVTVVQNDVTVTVDQTTTVKMALTVGSTTEVVTVKGGTSLTESTNSTVGQLISAATIDRVPLLTRDVYDLVQLSPGVTPANGAPNSSNSQQISSITSGRPGIDVSSYTINGAIVGSVYYMVDGSPIGVAENNAGTILPAMVIPEDAVEETRIETQNTPASYQSGGAGVISLATKSGGDHFHGNLFGVFRPNTLASNEYFNKQNELGSGLPNTPPSFHRYQEGGAIGGPILHSKLFFFADYEATQQALFDGSNIFTVPTTAERTGNFSADSFTIYNPLAPDNPDGTRQPFPNNIIPNPNPIAVQFLSEMPKCNVPNPSTCDANPNGAVNNFYAPGVDPSSAQKFDLRFDFDKSEKQHIFGRFSFARLSSSLVNAFNNMWDPFYAQNITNARNLLLADDYTFNSNTVLQLRYSFTRHYENQTGDPRQTGFDITSLGFPASLAAQENYKTLPYVMFNDIGGGVGGTANWDTFVYASENNDVSASVTRVQGKHQISAGFEYMKRFLNVGQPPAPSGGYYFDVSATDQSVANGGGGSDFASFLTGMGTPPGSESYNFTKDLFVAESNPYYGAFVEDVYHPLNNLTITAGLRWDVLGGRNERHNRLEYFNPTASGAADGVSYTGAEVYVNSGNRSPFATNLGDVGPRLGITWQPATHLVVRGGGGIYYGPSPEMAANGSLNSDGFSSVTNWNATCYNNDGNTTYNGTSGCAGAAPGSPAPSTTGIYSLSNPFPNGVVPVFSAPPPGLANNLGQTLNTVLHNPRTPTTYNYNFGVDYQFPHEVILSLAYVGSRGLFLPMGQVDMNTLSLETIGRYGAALCVDPSNPACQTVNNTWAPIQPATNSNYGSPTVPLWVSLQEFPQFGNGGYGSGNGVLLNGDPVGDSEYNSLQAKMQKRLTHHFTTLASFTWAKLITDDGNPPLGFVGSHGGAPQDIKDLRYEHSVSPQDVKYQFTGEVSYDLPVGPGRLVQLNRVGDAFLGGWTANGILYLSSGIPIASPVVGAPVSYFNQRPDLTCDPSKGAPHSATTWFNPTCFAMPSSPFVAGTAPAYLDHVRTMGARNLDISLYKSFQMGEARNLRFDISSYNVTNRAQLGMPNVPSINDVQTQPSVAATFGQVTNTVNTPRQFQFGARFSF